MGGQRRGEGKIIKHPIHIRMEKKSLWSIGRSKLGFVVSMWFFSWMLSIVLRGTSFGWHGLVTVLSVTSDFLFAWFLPGPGRQRREMPRDRHGFVWTPITYPAQTPSCAKWGTKAPQRLHTIPEPASLSVQSLWMPRLQHTPKHQCVPKCLMTESNCFYLSHRNVSFSKPKVSLNVALNSAFCIHTVLCSI